MSGKPSAGEKKRKWSAAESGREEEAVRHKRVQKEAKRRKEA